MSGIFLLKFSTEMLIRTINRTLTHNGLRIYEVRLNEILNYKQMLVGVSCIYAVIRCKNYGYGTETK